MIKTIYIKTSDKIGAIQIKFQGKEIYSENKISGQRYITVTVTDLIDLEHKLAEL